MKIVLEESEASKYCLDKAEKLTDTVAIRRGLWSLLEKAREMSGFDHTADKMLIQLYPGRGQGCELFVTRLGLLSKESSRLIEKSKSVTLLSGLVRVYRFASLTDLREAVLMIKNNPSGIIPKGKIYVDGTGRYYLELEEIGRVGGLPEFPELLEFSELLWDDSRYYVSEHLKLVSDDYLKYENSASK